MQNKNPNKLEANMSHRYVHFKLPDNFTKHTVCESCNKKQKFISNYISTKKYSKYNAIPLSFLNEIKKTANVYFLFMAFFSLFKNSPIDPFFSFVPIIFVITLSVIKDISGDYSRYTLDKSINNKEAFVFKNDKFVSTFWKDIKVGDICFIKEGEVFPGDTILIGSSDRSGLAFIETSSFDGETNLKIKQVNTLLMKEGDEYQQASKVKGILKSSSPQKRLDFEGWSGTFLQEDKEVVLTHSQFIPRSCVLKNTKWIIGITVFTGSETKISLNSKKTKTKRSSIERLIDKVMLTFILVEFVYAAFLIFFYWLWGAEVYTKSWYLSQNVKGEFEKLTANSMLIQLISYFVISQNLIPISLYIMMEFVKSIQSFFIRYDLQMYDKKKLFLPKVQTSGINEDLGRVSYLFTDKTGTLTENKMFFKKCFVNGKVFGGKRNIPKKQFYTTPKFIENATDRFADNAFFETLMEPNSPQSGRKLDNFMLALATCHSVLANINRDNEMEFQASSPDEKALLVFAAKYGYYFYARKSENIKVGKTEIDGQILLINIFGKQHIFEMVELIEFTSDRKKMSVLLHDPRSNTLKVFCKGADSEVKKLLLAEEQVSFAELEVELSDFASEGLRTLCIATKELTFQEFDKWIELTEVDKINNSKNADAFLESSLFLVGATAIEDTLQKGVPETIELVRKAGIQVWMLTGDKTETAINIGRSSKIIPETKEAVFVLDVSFGNSQQKEILQCLKNKLSNRLITLKTKTNTNNEVCVITGRALDEIFTEENSDVYLRNKKLLLELQRLFFEVSGKCKALICCRASPKQKEKLVQLVQAETAGVVLAVGDGANDVPMIKQADIGVGLMGQEGSEAANSSDYALGRFRFLQSLLFVHGSWNYTRVCKLVHMFLFKNILISVVTMAYAFYNGFSASLFSHSSYLSYYNLFFTTLPAIFLGVFDTEYSKETAFRFPYLYTFGVRNVFFNPKKALVTVAKAVYSALVVFYLTVVVFNEPFTKEGYSSGLPLASTAATNSLVVLANLYALTETRNWNSLLFTFSLGSVLVWLVYLFIFTLNSRSAENFYWVGVLLGTSPIFYAYLLLVIVLCFAPILFFKFLHKVLLPTTIDVVQEAELGIIPTDSVKDHIFSAYNLAKPQIKKQNAGLPLLSGYTPFYQDVHDKDYTISQKEMIGLKLKKKDIIRKNS